MKKLITCNDGTWDKPGALSKDGKPLDSNVCLLYQAIAKYDDKGLQQLKAYDTGVGTSYSLKDKLGGGITGVGIDKKVKDMYSFLVLNYEPGDEIYLFGFSRGAYTARSLGGFIRNCGILKPAHINLIDKAYELYRDKTDYSKPDDDMMTAFRRNYCFENVTRIKFIGVWDTVGALGLPLPFRQKYNQERYKFHDVKLSSTVDYAYHALAIDERRKPFDSSLWELSSGSENSKTIEIEQRWFAGVHANVGGGYANRGLSTLALNWMMQKATLNKSGLKFDPVKYIETNPGVVENSYTSLYWITGKIWRTVKDPKYPNQTIDDSVRQRILADKKYRPQNLKEHFKDIW